VERDAQHSQNHGNPPGYLLGGTEFHPVTSLNQVIIIERAAAAADQA
jgi:hypothetical protein